MKRSFLIPISLLLFSLVIFANSSAYAQTPNAPVITWPPPDVTIESNRPDFTWNGDPHDMYEVHVNTTNNPADVNGWNSGQVSSSGNTAMCGALSPQTTYYVFARLRNASGWSAWSANSRRFYVGAQFLNDPYFVGEPSGGQWPQHTVFNPARNEYLVAFPDSGNVSYYRLDSTGAKIGAKVTITDDAYLDGVHEAHVAYNSVNAEYLIVYSGWTQDNTPQVHDDIRAQRVNSSTGAKIGGSFMIMTPSPYSAVYELNLSYSPTSNVYFVAWHHGTSINILGYRLAGATGTVTGSQIVVSTGWSRLCAIPNIAYNSSANEFEVMYQVDREDIGAGWDLYGQRVRASDGALLGGMHAISTASPQWDMNGDIAYDSNLNRYLAVFESHSAPNHIWGQFLTATGGLSGSRFPLLSDPYSGGAVHVDWLPSTKEYVCAFHDCCTANDYARRISQTGVVLGERFKTTGAIGGNGNFYPTPVANTVNNEFLITWFKDYSDVYNRRYKTFTPFNLPLSVAIDLGGTNLEFGITSPVGGDGDTVNVSMGGRDCRRNMDPSFNDAYHYFAVSDSFAFQGNNPQLSISFDYYDTGTGTMTLHYDSTTNAYTNGGTVTLTNTNTWKTATLSVSNAYFGNRENNGADFRIYSGGGGATRYLDFVKVAVNLAPPPGQAGNPSPANGATGVSITTTLSWTAGSGATSHDVHFGTANPPPFIQNQTGTTYNPGTTTPGTTYFWRIDEKNASGTTTGTVWSYTTLPLPGAASSPNPSNGAILVDRNADLSWTAGSNTTSHDVRFGTANPPPFVINQTSTTYDPGTMTPNTTYFWRIDEKNASGTTTGTVWSFTTLPLPGLASVPSPVSGATGLSITTIVSWTAGANAASHDVRFGTANPPPFVQNQAGTTYNPGTLNATTTYYWRIDEVNASGTTTGTVWSFTTATPPAAPTVTAPANGSTTTSLTPTITWTGDAHDQYQVRVSQQNDSNTSTNGWDSGTVTSTGNSAVSGTLRNYSFYYVFVRLHNAGGWGNWSAGGYNFIVNTGTSNGTVYLGNALPSASGWTVYDTGSYENGNGITSSIVADGGSNVWSLLDNSGTNRCKERYSVTNVSFDTGASVASRFRATGISGTPTYNLGISNGNVGGMFLRLYTNEVRLVDINGTNAGSYLLDATIYHKYQLTVKNATAGNNATAAWKVYVDGTLRISWTGAGVHNGFDGFMAGQAGTAATGTWWFDNISGRSDGEFTPAQCDPVY